MNKVAMLMVLLALGFSGCGKGDTGEQGVAGLDAPPATLAPLPPTAAQVEQSKIDDIVYQENLFRYHNVGNQLTTGLACAVYKTQFTGAISILGSGSNGLGTLSLVVQYPYVGYFAQDTQKQSDGLSFILDPYRSQASNQMEVYVKCTGVLVITTTQPHNFEYRSDDNLVYSINGTQITTPTLDDINHGAYPVNGKILSLKEGALPAISIQYRQYNGASTLELYQNGGWLDPKYLYH